MKNQTLLLALGLLLMLASCDFSGTSLNSVTDQNGSEDSQSTTLQLVSGDVEGVINEEKFDKSQSSTTVTISDIPSSLDAFLDLQQQISVDPQGAVVMMLVAIHIFQNNPDEGMQCLTAAATFPLTKESDEKGNYEGYIMSNVSTLKRNLESYPRIPFVYYQGSTPENGYVPDGPPFVVKMTTNPYSYSSGSDGMRIKFFVDTKGADSNRPTTVKKVNGIYKVTEFSSLYLSYKPVK